MRRRTLVTGAGGYLGERIARALLETRDASLVLWARPRQVAAVAQRFRRFGDRVVVCAGDLDDAAPFAAVDRRAVGAIVHAAAITRFDVDAVRAERSNVDGTQKLLAFAASCPSIETFAHLSSVYATGLADGVVREARAVDPPGFANEYERSKWRAEERVLAGAVPFRRQIFRVATVLCDDEGGAVTQHNVVWRMLKLLHTGLLPIVPGRPETPSYLVTGAFVADAIAALLGTGDDGGVFQVSPSFAEAPTLRELIDWSHAALAADDGFRRRRVLKPLFADAATFDYLARTATTFSSDIGPVISLVRPFARQLFVVKQVDNARLRAAWPAGRLSPLAGLVARTCEWLVRGDRLTSEVA